ncbi:MAG TPA: dephospho-CoA kinase [Thermoanaerobaculia bacterium]
MILKAGLTGGLASGKSTIRRMFADLGCATVDADAIVSRLYQPGEAGHAALLETYGPAILLADGQVDRQKLSALAFSSPGGAQKLNSLIHPLVMAEDARLTEEALKRSAGNDVIYVVEATLLIEAGGRERYDRMIVVDVAPEVQIPRAVARGMDETEARRRIEHQMKREERLRFADYVIDNSGDQERAAAETRRVYEQLRVDLARKKEASGYAPEAS